MVGDITRRAKMKRKGLNVLFKLLFSRTMVTMLLLLLQIVLFFVVFHLMGSYWQGFWVAGSLLSVALIVYIINVNENPAFKLAWMIPICAFPVFGATVFCFVMSNPGTRKMKKQLDRRKIETIPYLQPNEEVVEQMEQEFMPICDLAYYLQNINQMPVYANTDITYFALGEEKFMDLLLELKSARNFIFIEYFIISKGKIWGEILEILEQKVKEGVEVRVMYDGMCSLVNLPFHYPRELEKIGIRAKMFAPIRPLLSSHQNSRDHRKILVIDGRVAYNGGINLADEYMNEVERFGHWKDTAVKLEGDGVKSFTAMFLQMWNVSETGEEDYGRYLNVNAHPVKDKDTGYVIPYNDDPANREDVAEAVYMDILFKAKRYVHIMTPYLIIDHEMEVALMFAAKRGVDVKILLPHIPDKKIAFCIARTYYKGLLEAGVKIYEYTPGFVHAKSFVSDDERAVVGSINLDFRSLYEHFECATFIYKNQAIYDIEKDFQDTIQKSILVTKEYYDALPLRQRLAGRVFRLFGPLM